jgi:methylmalonyl-CoA/ethylmalonyl-CoA epimerase
MTMSTLATGLRQVAQRAADLDRSLGFYRDLLGLPFIARFDPPGLAFCDLGAGTRLLLEAGATPALLYFQVDDIHAALGRLRDANVPVEAEPHVIHTDTEGQFGAAGGEEWMAFVRDPDDNLVGLVERRDPA